VRQQKDRLQLRVPPGVDGNEPAFLLMAGGGECVQVALRQARGLQTRRHALGGQRAVPGRQRRVCFDELLVQLAEALLAGWRVAGRRGSDGECDERGGEGEQFLHGIGASSKVID
jgi:hypothetical protein